jgi:hypothetical protein
VKSGKDFRYAFISVSSGRFVGAGYTGKKRRVKVKINREALKRAGAAAKKRAAAKRFASKQKTLRTKRSKAARATGLRSLGMKTRKKSKRVSQVYSLPFRKQLYSIPFSRKYAANKKGRRSLEWVPSLEALEELFRIEKASGVVASIACWFHCQFKDGDDRWVFVHKRVLADEPKGAEIMWRAIFGKLAEYEIKQVYEIHLHVDYSEE